MAELENVSQVAIRQGCRRPSALSTERSKTLQAKEIALLLKQTAARYPHQDFSDQAITEGLLHDFMLLAERSGVAMVREALRELRIRPGQRFFPQPSEVAEEIEHMQRKQQAAVAVAVPAPIACPECDGMHMVVRETPTGKRYAELCHCWIDYKARLKAAREQPVAALDGKTRSAG